MDDEGIMRSKWRILKLPSVQGPTGQSGHTSAFRSPPLGPVPKVVKIGRQGRETVGTFPLLPAYFSATPPGGV